MGSKSVIVEMKDGFIYDLEAIAKVVTKIQSYFYNKS